jgi:hypothetical protein
MYILEYQYISKIKSLQFRGKPGNCGERSGEKEIINRASAHKQDLNMAEYTESAYPGARVVMIGDHNVSNYFEAGCNPTIHQHGGSSSATESVVNVRQNVDARQHFIDNMMVVVKDKTKLAEILDQLAVCATAGEVRDAVVKISKEYDILDYGWWSRDVNGLLQCVGDFEKGRNANNLRKLMSTALAALKLQEAHKKK